MYLCVRERENEWGIDKWREWVCVREKHKGRDKWNKSLWESEWEQEKKKEEVEGEKLYSWDQMSKNVLNVLLKDIST